MLFMSASHWGRCVWTRLNGLNTQMMQTEDKQISLADPDARSMATSGRGSGMVGYNVQSAAIIPAIGNSLDDLRTR
jgi:hypothetical protein